MSDIKELKDDTLEKVIGGVGGSNFDLTDEMIASGNYLVGQRDMITYNKVVYYNLETRVLINGSYMFIYEAESGQRLYIPLNNYS